MIGKATMDLLRTLPYLLPYVISLALSLGVGVYSWRRRDVGGAAALAICAWAEASWTASHIFELLSPGLGGKIFWNNVEFVGLFLAPMALLVFSLQYTGRRLAHPGRLWGLLAIVPVLSMLLIFTDPFHRLVRPSVSLIPGEPFSELDFRYSLPLWGMFVYACGLNVASILILAARYIGSPRLSRIQIGTMVIGCLLPLSTAIPILMSVRLTGHRDIMPLLFGPSNLIVAWGVFRYRLLDIVPVAHDLVIKSMSDATLVLDTQDRLVDLNPTAQALMGRPVSEIVGQPAEQIFTHWHDLVERYQGVEEARAEVAAHVEGEQRYFDYRLSSIRDQRGRLMGRLVVVRDATEYKRAVEALKLSEEKYRVLVENINDVIYSTDTQGNVTYVSPSIEQFALYPASELVGQPFARFVHPDDLPIARASFEQILNGILEPSEFRILAKDGTVLHVRTSSRPLSVGDQVVGLSGVLVNLTQRKQAEEELEKRRCQLERLVEERTAELKASNEQLQQEVAERKWTAALQLALYRISSEASAARDMQDFYVVIHNIIGTLMYTGNFYIALYDEGSQTLHFPYFVDEIDSTPPPSPLRKGLTDYVVRTGQPLLATPEVFEQLVDRGEVELFGAPSVDWLGVPLKSAEKTIGVIVVQSYNEAIRFSEKEKNLLTFVSQQIASTLERKRAEESLRRANIVLENSPAVLFRWQAAEGWPVEFVSQNVTRWGYRPEDLISGKIPYIAMLYPDDIERVAREVEEYSAGSATSFQQEYRIITGDGKLRWVDDRTVIERDASGRVTHYQGVVLDITERKQAEEALRESEQLLSKTFASLQEAIFIVDAATTKIIDCNPAAPGVFGYTREEMVGRTTAFLHIDEAALEEFRRHLRSAEEEKGFLFLPEFRMKRKDGTIIDTEHSVTPLEGAGGERVGWVSVVRDITERRQIQERYRLITSLTSDYIFYAHLDPSSGLGAVWIEGAFESITGYTPEEFNALGGWRAILHRDDHAQDDRDMAQLRSNQKTVTEVRVIRKDGAVRWVRAYAHPVWDEARNLLVGINGAVQDINERKQAEKVLNRRAAQLAILNDVGTQIVAELALNNVLDRATHLIQENFGYHHVAIFTVDREQGQAVMKTRAGLFVDLFPPEHRLKLGQGMIGWVAQHGELLRADDVRANPHFVSFYPEEIPTRSELTVPIRVGQDVVGVLDAQSPQLGVFDENDVMVMETLADQIALAMVNARLYESVRQELEERRRAEEALRESEAQYRSLFENSPTSLWEEDFSGVKAHLDDLRASGVADFREYFASHPEAVVQCASLVRIYNVNQATLNLYKAKTREELYGGLDRVFVDESFNIFREEVLALAEGHGRFESDIVGRSLTGNLIQCIVGVSVAPGYEKTWAKVFVSVVDITERVRTEAALQRHMVRMRILHEIDRAILVAQSPEATAQAALDRLRQLTGCPRISVSLFDFAANQAWALAISTAAPSQITAGMHVSLETFGLYWIKVLQQRRPYIAKDISELPESSEGDRVLASEGLRAWLALPLVYKGELIGSLNLGAADPVSFDAEMIDLAGQVADQLAIAIQQARLLEQVQRHTTELEQRVAERTAELQAAYERLQALDRIKDEFVSNVSHELRTPIASIKLYLHMLDLRPDKRGSYMDTLGRETARLEDLIENILTLSRLDQGRVEINSLPVDLNTLVGEYVTDRTPLAESKGLTLAFKPASRMQTVKADHRLLGQVLGILLTNALSYTPTGGQIVVHTHKRRFAGQSWAGFSVSDTGPGIPPEEQPQLFTRFFRGKVGRESGTPGTGLGLAIAKEIVERHQGRIELDGKSTRNKGATFCVWLPADVS